MLSKVHLRRGDYTACHRRLEQRLARDVRLYGYGTPWVNGAHIVLTSTVESDVTCKRCLDSQNG